MLQFYAVSCVSDTSMESLVSAQCAAIPLDCDVPSLIDPGVTGADISSVISNILDEVVSCLCIHHLERL